MTRPLHPAELAQLLHTRFVARAAAIGVLLIAAALLAGGSRSKLPESRLWLFGGALGCAVLSRAVHGLAIDAERLFDDSRDISLSNWQNQLFQRTRDASLTLEAQLVPPPPERLPLFDWRELRDSDQHPVLGIVSPMGGGKSRFAKYLARHVLFDSAAEVTAFDTYGRQGEWDRCATEPDEMLAIMRADLAEIDALKLAYRQGQNEFPPHLRVFEEIVDTLPAIRALDKQADQDVTRWLRAHVSVARKIGYRLCLISVKIGAAEIGVGSESRNDATLIFPGNKGIQKAMSDTRYLRLGTKDNTDLRDQLRASLAGIKRPALVFAQGEWFPAEIPELIDTGELISLPALVPSFRETEETLEEADPDTLNEIEALAIRLRDRNESCTPGNVRRYLRAYKEKSDEVIIELFHRLESQGRGRLDRSGKTVKLRVE